MNILDVARAAAVSKQTVSRVINGRYDVADSTRIRVQQVVAELGFRPNASARSLLTGRTSILGLVVPDITNPFFIDIVRGVQSAAEEKGYHVLLYNTGDSYDSEAQSVQLLGERRADGIIMCSSRLSDERLTELLHGVARVVLVNRWVEDLQVPQIGADYTRGVRSSVEYLVNHGHRRIGIITLETETANSQAKLRGYREAIAEAGLPVTPNLIARTVSSISGGFAAAVALLERSEPPTAIIAYSDATGLGVLHACHHRGLSVPGDLAVIGFGGSEVAAFANPSLSTIAVPNYQMGRMAVDLLLERVDGKGVTAPRIVTEPQLILRGSTGDADVGDSLFGTGVSLQLRAQRDCPHECFHGSPISRQSHPLVPGARAVA